MNKNNIIRQCEQRNALRRVYRERIDCSTFFQNVKGNMLISGMHASNSKLLSDMIKSYYERRDMPTIVLTSHLELLRQLTAESLSGTLPEVILFEPEEKNYHPMYGMNSQQICQLIQAAGENLGCGQILSQVLLYAAAVMDTVSLKYPPSLPAISHLLKNDDDFIADFASKGGLSNITCGNITGNQAAGTLLRRIIGHLEDTFENVSDSQTDTRHSFQSSIQNHVPFMVFYQLSRNQGLMNLYLKEELYSTLQHTPRIRIILDEVFFTGDSDCLLPYLLQLKRSGQAELIACSENAMKMLQKEATDFSNTCLFPHATPTLTEELSEQAFGKYQYHYPVLTAGKPPSLLFTLKTDSHWAMASEERLRVRALDLEENRLFGGMTEVLAIKTGNSINVYMIPIPVFLAASAKIYPLKKGA